MVGSCDFCLFLGRLCYTGVQPANKYVTSPINRLRKLDKTNGRPVLLFFFVCTIVMYLERFNILSFDDNDDNSNIKSNYFVAGRSSCNTCAVTAMGDSVGVITGWPTSFVSPLFHYWFVNFILGLTQTEAHIHISDQSVTVILQNLGRCSIKMCQPSSCYPAVLLYEKFYLYYNTVIVTPLQISTDTVLWIPLLPLECIIFVTRNM